MSEIGNPCNPTSALSHYDKCAVNSVSYATTTLCRVEDQYFFNSFVSISSTDKMNKYLKN